MVISPFFDDLVESAVLGFSRKLRTLDIRRQQQRGATHDARNPANAPVFKPAAREGWFQRLGDKKIGIVVVAGWCSLSAVMP
jgi:hypothetical protein